MKQRLGLACALIHDPQLIILDEPTNGLDPQGIAEIRRLIMHLAHDLGKTVLVSSHLLNEMEMMADHMLIINKGKKVVEGKVSELLNPEQSLVELVTGDETAAMQFILHSEWKAFLKNNDQQIIRLEMNKERIPELNRQLVQNGIPVSSLRPVHSLEEYFLSLTRE
jgi:ABC-2 type transport system ATP-binding protein